MTKKGLTVWMFIVVAMLSGFVNTATAALSPWPMEGGNRFNTRSTSIVGPTVPVLKWSVQIPGGGLGKPSIGSDGNIYVESNNFYLTAVSPSGSVVWQRTDHYDGVTPAVGSNGNLYTYIYPPSSRSRPTCLDPNGELVWTGEPYDWGIPKSPTIAADGSVYFHTAKYTPDGDLIEPGYEGSTYVARPVSEARDSVNPDVYFTKCSALGGGADFCASYVGLNDYNEPVWKTRWSLHSGGCTFRRATVCSDGKVIVPDVYDGCTYLRAFGPTGDSLWTFTICYTYGTYAYDGMAIGSDETIYAVGDANLYAINPNGSKRWTTNLGTSESPPVVDGADTIYCATVYNLVAVASDGLTKWVLDLPGAGLPCAPPVFGNDGTMYITSNGYLHAFDAALRLLAPNGGEELMADSTYTIQWETEGEISNVLIEYSTNNGSAWTAVDPPNTGNSGLYDWLVPAVDSNECLVRVSDAGDPSVYDTSNNLFTMFICQGPIEGDLNEDCYVNFRDFAIFATHWLECGNRFDPACGLE